MPRGGKRTGAGRRKKTELPAVLDGLPVRKQKYLQGRVDGKSKRQAALDAGYSQDVADNPGRSIETANVREAFQKLIRHTIPAEKISQRIAEGLDAMETKFFAEKGRVVDSREIVAWSERRQYAELAAEYGGLHNLKEPIPPEPPKGASVYRALGQKTTVTERKTVIHQREVTEQQTATLEVRTEAPGVQDPNGFVIEVEEY